MKLADRNAEKNLKVSLLSKKSYPKCFDSLRQYEEWLEAEQVAQTQAFRRNICEDCTAGFKTQMILSHRCVNIDLKIKD